MEVPPMTRSLFLSVALTALAAAGAAAADSKGGSVPADSFYALKTTTLQGQPADLSQYAGKVTLVVNTASQCGYTPQYAGLEKLHEDMQGRGFSVLGGGDPDLLQEELRGHLPHVLEGGDQGRPRAVAGLHLPGQGRPPAGLE